MRAALLLAAGMAACVPSVKEIEAPTRRTIATRLGEEPMTMEDAEVAAALELPLTRSSVARIALGRNPRVAAALASLGVAAGEAASLRSLGRTDLDASMYFNDDASLLGGHVEVVHGVLDLILAAPRRRAGDAAMAAAQARAAAEILMVVARADRAFLAVTAASEELRAARSTFDAAAAGADLIERVHAAGGTHDLALAREQGLREETRLEVARAEAAIEAAREELNAALGLSGDETRWTTDAGVPPLPDAAPKLDDLESTAVATSLELAALRHDALGAANRARDAGVKAWLPDVGVGVAAEYHDGGWFPGPALRLGIPLVSGERGRAAGMRAEERRVAALTAAVAIEVRASARAARMRALAAFDEARHVRDVLLPLRRKVLEETVLQWNAMNAGPLELLAARRELASAERMSIDAHRRFASAMIDVEALRHGAPVGVATMPMSAPPAGAVEERGGGH